MKSRTTKRFRKAFASLPDDAKRQTRIAYRRFRDDPQHPGLRFKRVHPREPIYSVRVSRGIRALGVKEGETMIWFWIGSHDDYDRLIAGL